MCHSSDCAVLIEWLYRKSKAASGATKASAAKTAGLSAKDAARAKEIRAQIQKLQAELNALEKKGSKTKATSKKAKAKAKAKPEKSGPKRLVQTLCRTSDVSDWVQGTLCIYLLHIRGQARFREQEPGRPCN